MGLTTSPIDWYAARAAGIVAYLLLTVVVLVGLTLSGQLRLPQWPRFAVTDLHRFGGLLVGVFVSIHVATIALDSYTPFSLSQLVVPFTSHYRLVWTALGIVGAELLIAIAITNALRNVIRYRWWRRIHVLNFVVWLAASVHGIGAGTDTPAAWMTLIYTVCVSSVLAAFAWRAGRRRLSTGAVRGLAGAGGLLGVAAVLVLASITHSRVALPTAVALPHSFSDSFSGSLSQENGAAAALVSINGRGTGSTPVLVRIDLVTTDGRFFSDSALQLEDSTNGSICTGTISNIGNSGFTGRCSFPTGSPRAVAANWQLDAGNITGTLSLTA